MKKTRSIQIIWLIVLIYSCERKPVEVNLDNRTEEDLRKDETIFITGDPDHGVAILELEQQLSTLVKGVEKRDAKLIFDIFSDKPNSRYIRNGFVYPNIRKARRDYMKTFRQSADTTKRKLAFTSKHYDIVSDQMVLLTAEGAMEKVIQQPGDKAWEIKYTIVWVKDIDDGWEAMNMHISWPKSIS